MEYGLPDVRRSAKAFITLMIFELLGSAVWVMAFNYSNNNYFVRAASFFFMWMIASTVSGAHFNPAISLAVYMSQRKYRKLFPYLFCVWIA